MARVDVFLVSERAGFITAEVMNATGEGGTGQGDEQNTGSADPEQPVPDEPPD